MLADFISSKTRVKLLLKFFLNSKNSSYLRGLAEEFDESTNAVRLELNRLMKAGMLTARPIGNKVVYSANDQYPLYREIQQIVRKHLGIDQIILNVIERLGDVDKAYLTGSFSEGSDAQIIDIILVGNIETEYLTVLITKVERLIQRRVRYLLYTTQEWSEDMLANFSGQPMLIWDQKEVLV